MADGPNYLGDQVPNLRSSPKKPKGNGPNYLGRDTGVDWEQHEKDVAKRSGGRVTPGSGAVPGKPADTFDQEFLRDCKATKGAGITIKAKWLTQIAKQASPRGKTPLVELRLEGQEPPTPTDWVMIPAQDFEILLERLRGDT